MPETITYPKKHFRGQTQDEEVILFFRKHWIVLLKYFFYAVLLLIFFIFSLIVLIMTITGTLPLREEVVVRVFFTSSILLMLICGTYIFVTLTNYYLDIVIITNLRVVEVQKTIFFKNKVYAIDLQNIQEIKAEKEGFISNSFSFGNIILFSHNTNMEKTLLTVPTPHYYADVITRLRHGDFMQNYNTEE